MENNADDIETLEIFSREPVFKQEFCLLCKELIPEEAYGSSAVWVIENAVYAGFCNFAHRDMFYKQGLWKENLPPPLEIGD